MNTTQPDLIDGAEYVSRGGQKLEKALTHFEISPAGKICIDCGASTGGFTDCLLKRGAKLVYAIDVGYGQLAWTLRNDPRVITMERTNIRYVTSDMLEIKPEFAVIDVSFISLALVLPVIRKLLAEENRTVSAANNHEADCPERNHKETCPANIYEAICLIKPQFEAGRGKVGKKGVVRDPATHKEVLGAFIENAEKSGFSIKGLTYSPVKGPKGNIEYLGYLSTQGESASIDIDTIVKESHSLL